MLHIQPTIHNRAAREDLLSRDRVLLVDLPSDFDYNAILQPIYFHHHKPVLYIGIALEQRLGPPQEEERVMRSSDENGPCPLLPGARVRICEPTLQAYYGVYGTVIRLHGCASRPLTYVDVQMDDVSPDEGHAVFYVHEVSPVADAPSTSAPA